MTIYYLIVYKDGTLGIYGRAPNSEHHQKDAKCYQIPENVTIANLSECIFKQFDEGFMLRLFKIKKIW